MLLAGLSAIAAPVVATLATTNSVDRKWDSKKFANIKGEQKKEPVVMHREEASAQAPKPAPRPPKYPKRSVELLQNMEHSFGSFGVVSLSNPSAQVGDREQRNYVENSTPDFHSTGGSSFLTLTLGESILEQTPTMKDVTVRAQGLAKNIKGNMKVLKIGNDTASGIVNINGDGTVTFQKGLVCGKRTLATQPGTKVSVDFPDPKVTSMMDYDARNRVDKVDSVTNPRMDFDENGRAILLNSLENRDSLQEERDAVGRERLRSIRKIGEVSALRSNESWVRPPNMEHADLDERAAGRIARDGCPVRRGGRNWTNEKGRMDNAVNMKMRSKPLRLQRSDMAVKHGIMTPNVVRVHNARSVAENDSRSRTGRNYAVGNRSTRDRADLASRNRSRSDRIVRRKEEVGGFRPRTKDVKEVRRGARTRTATKLRRLDVIPGILVDRTTGSMEVRANVAPRNPFTKQRKEIDGVYDALAKGGMKHTERPNEKTLGSKNAVKFQSDEYGTIHGSNNVIHGSHRGGARDVAIRTDGRVVNRLNRKEAWASGDGSIGATQGDNRLDLAGRKNSNFGGRVATNLTREHVERERNVDNITDQTYRHERVHTKYVYDQQKDVSAAGDRYRGAALNTDVPVSIDGNKSGHLRSKWVQDASNRVGLVGNQALMNGVASLSTLGMSKETTSNRDTVSTIRDERILAPMAASSVMMDTAGVQKTMRFVKATETNNAVKQIFETRSAPRMYVPEDAEEPDVDNITTDFSQQNPAVPPVVYDPHSNIVPRVAMDTGAAREEDVSQEPLTNPIPEEHEMDRDVRFLEHSIQDNDIDA